MTTVTPMPSRNSEHGDAQAAARSKTIMDAVMQAVNVLEKAEVALDEDAAARSASQSHKNRNFKPKPAKTIPFQRLELNAKDDLKNDDATRSVISRWVFTRVVTCD